MYLWSFHTPNPVGSLIVSFSFPVAMTLLFRKNLKNTQLIALAWMMVFIALGQYILLGVLELQKRNISGNFYWGIVPSLYILFLVLVVELIILTDLSIKKYPIKCGVCYVILTLHFLSGILYFIRTSLGYNVGA